MTAGRGEKASGAVRWYGVALRLLPAAYRRELGDAMLETFALKVRASGSVASRWNLTVREIAGIVGLAWQERRERPARRRHRGGSWRGGALPSELRQASRRLARSPGFTLASILTLAVAIGGNVAIFSVVYSILHKPLPYPDSERLVAIRAAVPAAGIDDMETTIGLHLFFREAAASFRSLALYDRVYRNLTADGEPARLETIHGTEDFFAALGVPAALGRTLGAGDFTADSAPVIVLADAFWRQRYGADPAVLGRSVRLDDALFIVVGVMPRGFDFPRPGTDAWTAWSIDADRVSLMSFSYNAVARLAPGRTLESANVELAAIIDGYPERFGRDRDDWDQLGLVAFVRSLKEQTIGDVDQTLWLFAGAGLFIMMLACANVANLFLVRTEARRAEARVRAALGASPGQILGYWMAESAWVATLGALLGLGLAASIIDLLVRLAPDLPRIETVRLDGAALVFTGVVATVATLVFGTAPFFANRRSLASRPEGSRWSTGTASGVRGRELLVGAQVALALTLLVGAALMAQSLRNLTSADPGFEPRGVLTFRMSLPSSSYPDRVAAARFHQLLLDRFVALSGVEAAAVARCLPLQGWCGGNSVSSPDSPLAPEAFQKVVSVKPVSAGYFESLRIPLIAGRTFVPTDIEQRSGAAIVSEALADRLFPGAEPTEILGRRVYPQSDGDIDEWFTIVGISRVIKRAQIDEPPAEALYVPLLGVTGDRHLAPIHDVTVAVRVAGAPLDAIGPLRAALRELDAEVPIDTIRTLADIHAEANARNRFATLLLTLAAATGVLLGAIGVYGVVSWATRQRTAEFGVRAAFGARAADLLFMVMARSLKVIGSGVAIGIVASIGVTRLLTSMLYGVGATDPTTFVAVTATLAGIVAIATWIPARRAARIDPVEALRSR